MVKPIYSSAQRIAATAKAEADPETRSRLLADALISLARALAIDVAALDARMRALECVCRGRGAQASDQSVSEAIASRV